MTVPFGAMDRVGVLNSLFPRPSIAQPDVTVAKKQLSPLEKAQQEMHLYGITSEQRKGYIPRVSEVLYNTIEPFVYVRPDLSTVLKRLVFGQPEPMEGQPTAENPARHLGPKAIEDSWRLYLGMPQRNGTFSVSPYKPSISTEDKHYFRVNGFFDMLLNNGGRILPEEMRNKPTAAATVKAIVKAADVFRGGRIPANDDFSYDPKLTGIMANFQLMKGKDEKGHYIAMYDKWDLHTKYADKVGKPYEIYDRLYYDPKTFKPIPETKLQSVVPLTEAKNAKRRK